MTRGPLATEDYEARRAHSATLARFCAEAGRRLADGPEQVWSLEEDFRDLLGSDFVSNVVTQELELLLRDPAHVPAGGGSEADLAVVIEPTYILSLRLLRPDQKYTDKLYTASQHALLGVIALGADGVVPLDIYEQPDPAPFDVVDRAKLLRVSGSRVLGAHDVLRIRAGFDVFAIRPVPRPVLLISLGTENVVPLRVEYDPVTLAPVRAIAASVESSRLEFTARMLSEIGNARSPESLALLCDHPDHFVRWAAIRSIVRLDALVGRDHVERATQDPHPHVRRAAAVALPQIDAFLGSLTVPNGR